MNRTLFWSTFVQLSVFVHIINGNLFASNIAFNSPAASLEIATGSTLKVLNQITNSGGIIKNSGGTFTGSASGVTAIFNDGYFDNGNLLRATASYNLFGTNNMILAGSQVLKASPLAKIEALTVSGTGNQILGMPNFTGTPTLASGAELQLGIENDMTVNLALASGTLTLLNDLTWADGKQPTGTGTIKLNSGYKFILGSTPLTFSSAITWQGTGEIVLKAKTTLTATWTFSSGNVVINGNGNVLDISSGGLSVASGVTVYLTNVYVKGVGSTRLSGAGGTFRLSGSTLEMNAAAAYSSTGSIYVDGNSTIIMKGNALSFAGSSVLTVDGCTLWYDTQNATQSSAGPSGNVTLTNTGVVLDVRGYIPALGNIGNTPSAHLTFSGATTLNYDLNLSADHTLTISATATINGNYHTIRFANNKIAYINIGNGITATFTNCVFENFTAQHVGLVGTGAIVFGSNCRVNAMSNANWGKPFTFGANTVLNGNMGNITLAAGGSITSTDAAGTGLRLLDITIAGVNGTNLSCGVAGAKMIFDNATIVMSANWNFTTGFFEVFRAWNLKGLFNYIYSSTETSVIDANSQLTVEPGATFVYNPASGNTQISMVDKSSRLKFQGSTLDVSTVGLQLTLGTLAIDGQMNIVSSATSNAQAIKFGDGVSASNDLDIEIAPAASMNISSGIVLYQNLGG